MDEIESRLREIAEELYKRLLSQKDKYVVEIEGLENFKKFINEGYSVIVFYNPGCPVCKRFLPIFEEFALARKINGSNIKFAKINTTLKNNLILSIIYQVFAVPTIIIFKNGDLVVRHEGFMNLSELEDFVAKNIGEL
ncbi:MAG: thioredoxin family protein [Sulfolobales archaeon]